MPPKVMEKAASVSYPRVNELIHGKRGVTRDTAASTGATAGYGGTVLAQPPTGLGSLSRQALTGGEGDRKGQETSSTHEGVVGTEVVTFGYSVRTEDVRKNPDCREMGMVGRHL